MAKKIILNEGQLKMLLEKMATDSPSVVKKYPINTNKVLVVKKFLDDNFDRGLMDIIGDDGMPAQIQIVRMKSPSNNGEYLKDMYKEDLSDLLIDKFKDMFSDHIEREKFMAQIIADWYLEKIGTYGNLSVNYLK